MRAPRTLLRMGIVLAASLPLVRAGSAEENERVLAVRAGTLHVGDGTTIQQGMLLLRGSRIVGIGTDLEIPEGAELIELAEGTITPGLIDAGAQIASQLDFAPAQYASQQRAEERQARQLLDRLKLRANHDHDHDADPIHEEHICPICGGNAYLDHFMDSGGQRELKSEQSSEVVPHTRVLDAIDLHAADFSLLAGGGVTTVYLRPDTSAVIGPRGAIVKTVGSARRVIEEAAAVNAALGSAPIRGVLVRIPAPGRRYASHIARRPLTRMAVTWIFRKSLHDTLARQQGQEVAGADSPSREASDVLQLVLDKQVGLRISADARADIAAALRLSEEFDIDFTLDGGVEAYHHLTALKERNVPVVFGPINDDSSQPGVWGGEQLESRLDTLGALLEAQIQTALSAQHRRGEDGLSRQAMYAMRYGVSEPDALRAVTSTPAKILGISERTGTLVAGKDADLVLWSGPPFAALTRPVVVIIDGQIVIDRRPTS